MSNLSELIPAGGGQNNTDFVADGAITSGKPVILNSAGTVTQVGISTVAADIPYGSSSIWSTSAHSSYYQASTFHDPTNTGKFIVGYLNGSNYTTVLVGTTSGSTISYGTPIVLISATTYESPIIAWNPNKANQIAVFYYDNSLSFMAVGGTVASGSGTTITWATAVNVSGGSGSFWDRQIAFDPTQTSTPYRFLMNWYQQGTVKLRSCEITDADALTMGTVYSFTAAEYQDASMGISFDASGTFLFSAKEQGLNSIAGRTGSISGSGGSAAISISGETVITSTAASMALHDQSYAAQIDPNNDDKFLFVYNDTSNEQYCVIGSLSGSGSSATITMGTPVKYSTVTTGVEFLNWAFDPAGDKSFVITARNGTYAASRPLDNFAMLGTYSGTVPTIDSTMYFLNTLGSAKLMNEAVNFDTTSSVFYLSGVRNDNDDGTIYLGKMSVDATNMTATNLLGIASAAILDTATGTINTWGSRNEVQTSLTIGSDYYVQSDGTITTASASPAQLIGEAITATQINIKDYTG